MYVLGEGNVAAVHVHVYVLGVNVTFDHVKVNVFRGGANVASVHLHVYVLGQGQCCSPNHIHIVFVFS